jgi:hypothetical protein
MFLSFFYLFSARLWVMEKAGEAGAGILNG